jgi:hypothetical protein
MSLTSREQTVRAFQRTNQRRRLLVASSACTSRRKPATKWTGFGGPRRTADVVSPRFRFGGVAELVYGTGLEMRWV